MNKTYHFVYKEEGEKIYSKGVTVEAENPLKAFDEYYKQVPIGAMFIAMYCIEVVSEVLQLQKEIAGMPNAPLIVEIERKNIRDEINPD